MTAQESGMTGESRIAQNGNPAPRRPYARTFDKRRREILATAWAMVAETKGAEFTLQELSERCDVSLRTIYNAFGDKEGVIAAAAAAHHHQVLEGIAVASGDCWSLAEAVEMTRRVAHETARVPGFSQVTAEMYFSPRGHIKLTGSLRRMPGSILEAWLRSNEVDRKLVKALRWEDLEASHADAQWGAVAAWNAGQISAEDMERRMVCNFLVIAAAFGNRAGRSLAKQMMAAE